MAIKVLVDGKEVQCLNDVKVIVTLDMNDGTGEVHLNHTHEGVITDIVEHGEVTLSMCEDYYDVAERVDDYVDAQTKATLDSLAK